MIRIRAFRAVDDLVACQKFVEGHERVLKDIGVTKVTTANTDWIFNPAVFVLLIEAMDGDRAFGGARIHVVGGTQSLPIEDAVGEIDKNIYDQVKKYAVKGTGELCGLWNSGEVRGKGMSPLITNAAVSKAGISMMNQLNLNSLFVLCAPYTVRMAEKAGFVIAKSLGNNGTFYYPKEDLLATILIINDTETLNAAEPDTRERIFDLRKHPIQKKKEIGPNGEFEVEYDLLIPSLKMFS